MTNEFKEEVVTAMEKLVDDDVTVIQSRVLKINGEVKEGISFHRDNTPISPVLYWEDLLEKEVGETDAESVAEKLWSMYQDMGKNFHRSDMEAFMSWDKAKLHIRIRVINFDKNRELLEQVPYA